MSGFASAEIKAGQLNAVVKNIMRQTGIKDPVEAVRQFNAGLWFLSEPNRLWKGPAIYITVTSDGTTGPEWITRLESKGFRIDDDYPRRFLCSTDFKPTNGVIYQIVILKGMLFDDCDRKTNKIRAYAAERKLIVPNAEVACLIRDNFSNGEIQAMGLRQIVTMHEPINDSFGKPSLLMAGYDGDDRWSGTHFTQPDGGWLREYGFAFIISQFQN